MIMNINSSFCHLRHALQISSARGLNPTLFETEEGEKETTRK